MLPYVGPGSGAPTILSVAAITIELFEGLLLGAYPDTGGVWTIGYGHTGTIPGSAGPLPVVKGMIITRDLALKLFTADVAPLYELVKGRPLLEAAMLISFGFNTGIGTLRKLLSGQTTILDPVHQTDRTGKTLAFLTTRRTFEAEMIAVSDAITVKP